MTRVAGWLARWLAHGFRWLRILGYALPGLLLLSAAHTLGIAPGSVVSAELVASPVLLVGVVMFVAHAWRQNSVTASPVGQPVDAEPAQPPQPVGQANLANPARPPARATVTSIKVTSLQDPASPAGELPRAAGQHQHLTEPLWEVNDRGDR